MKDSKNSDLNCQYAIIDIGGKQFQAVEGKTLSVDRLAGSKPGDKIKFDKVLFGRKQDSTMLLGKPYLEGSFVEGTVVEHTRGPKLIVFKFRRRKGIRVKKGHRQDLCTIKFDNINLSA